MMRGMELPGLPGPLGIPEKLIRGLIDEIASLRRALDQIEPALESVRRVEVIAEEAIPVAERGIVVIERLIATIDSATEQIDPMIESMNAAQAQVDPLIKSVDEARAQVDPLIRTLDKALPALERAVTMTQPLEGSVERLGRALDRLPGGAASRRGRIGGPGDGSDEGETKD